jgi:DNA-binding transcriptional regulator YhcF (GntR family)
LRIEIDPNRPEPLRRQIENALRKQVLSGELRPGEQLPPARLLAEALDVNVHTVLIAYHALRDERLLEVTRRRGATVRRGAPTAGVERRLKIVLEEARLEGFSRDELIDLVRRLA